MEATERQLARLREWGIAHDKDITKEEAAELLREAMRARGIIGLRYIDITKIQHALVVEGEGDPLPGGRQWT